MDRWQPREEPLLRPDGGKNLARARESSVQRRGESLAERVRILV